MGFGKKHRSKQVKTGQNESKWTIGFQELGELAGAGEPEFQGTIQGAGAVEADAGDSTLEDRIQEIVIFRRGGAFECE